MDKARLGRQTHRGENCSDLSSLGPDGEDHGGGGEVLAGPGGEHEAEAGEAGDHAGGQ